MDVTAYEYAGTELDLFALAKNWKRYWSAHVRPYLKGDVLEVGAGMGANTPLLLGPSVETWTCLEPDQNLAERLRMSLDGKSDLSRHRVIQGTINDLSCPSTFDSILYIDVLEHIENDVQELRTAWTRLKTGGRLVVLAPAHQALYTPFDEAIGHYRRYSKGSLRSTAPCDGELKTLLYLDSVGLLASAANRFVLRSAMPSERQILTWDRVIVPLSRILDPLTFHRIGKTVLGIWMKH
jgi:hypothetical protein